MQFWAKTCRVLMWLVLLVCGSLQWLAIVSILIANGKSNEPYTIWPLIAARVLLTIAVVWFALKFPFAQKHRLWSVVAAGVASIVIFVVALDLWQILDIDKVAGMGGGITMGQLIGHHMSNLLTFVFMLIAHILERSAPKETVDEGETPFSAILAEIDKESSKK